MPWLNREVNVICVDAPHRVDMCIRLITDLLVTTNLRNFEFHQRIEPFLGTRTSHFIHELYVFARGPFDIFGYDRHVRYNELMPGTPPASPILIPDIGSSGSDSDEITFVEPTTRRRRTEFTFETRSDSSTFILTGSFDGGRAGIQYRHPQNPEYISTTIHSAAAPQTSYTATAAAAQSSASVHRAATTTNTAERRSSLCLSLLSSSDSDECEFVLEQKPPHLRTPEMVTLNSDSDSDVVFVEETRNEVEPNIKKRKHSPEPGIFESSIPATAVTATATTTSTSSSTQTSYSILPKMERSDNSSVISCTSSSSCAGPSTSSAASTSTDYSTLMQMPSTSASSSSTNEVYHNKKLPPIILKKYVYKKNKSFFDASSSCSEGESSHEEYKVYASIKRKKKSATQKRIKRENSSSTRKKTKHNKSRNRKKTSSMDRKKYSNEMVTATTMNSSTQSNMPDVKCKSSRKEKERKRKRKLKKRFSTSSEDPSSSSPDNNNSSPSGSDYDS